MPEKTTLKRARQAKRAGRAPTTQAGPFVREEIHHVREGKHGARSTQQAIAIGLSKARRAGVKLPRPPAARRAAARKAAPTKGPQVRRAAAKRAAQTKRSKGTQRRRRTAA
jgi:hypothetical protein